MTDNESTIEVPLPEGTRPNPDNVVTQEIPVVAETVELPEVPRKTYVVQTVPVHLLGDPILAMDDQPKKSPESVFELIQDQTETMVPPMPRPTRRPRRKIQTGDKVLAGMGAMAMVGVTVVYGMVAYGWGGGGMPGEAAPEPHRTIQISTPAETPSSSSSPTPRRSPSPPEEGTAPVVPVVAPKTHMPKPVKTFRPSPTPEKVSKSPSAPVTASGAPEPAQPSATPSASLSSSPTPSASATSFSPSPTVSVETSPLP